MGFQWAVVVATQTIIIVLGALHYILRRVVGRLLVTARYMSPYTNDNNNI